MTEFTDDSTSEFESLRPYQEACGYLASLERTEDWLLIEFSPRKLRFPIPSRKAEICQRELEGHEGQRVAILRAPLPDRPIIIRVKEE